MSTVSLPGSIVRGTSIVAVLKQGRLYVRGCQNVVRCASALVHIRAQTKRVQVRKGQLQVRCCAGSRVGMAKTLSSLRFARKEGPK